MNLESILYGAAKSLGNKFFPVMKKGADNKSNPTRSTLGDWLAQQFFHPPALSPLGQQAYAQTNTTPLAASPTQAQQYTQPQKQDYKPGLEQLTNQVLKGFQKYGSPLATAAADYARAGYQLQSQHPNADPLLPAVLSLKETSGGKHMAPHSANNPLNIGPNINYPSLGTNLMGGGTWGENGGPQEGLLGILQHPAYQKYLQSGNLNDFFPVYTPPQGNSPISSQVNDYNNLRSTFTQ